MGPQILGILKGVDMETPEPSGLEDMKGARVWKEWVKPKYLIKTN